VTRHRENGGDRRHPARRRILLVSRSFPGWDRLTGSVLGWLLVLIAVGPQYRWRKLAGEAAAGVPLRRSRIALRQA